MILFALLLLVPILQEPPPPTGLAPVLPPVDAKLHADVLSYLELSGAQKRMQDSYPDAIDDARPAMQRQCPKCTAEFYVEYKKRMLARIDPAPCMAASAAGFEKYLSDAEVLELIELQRAKNAGQTVTPSDSLRRKMTSVFSVMMPEIVGKCSEIGAKLGAEVGAEIGKEHPEYVNGPG